MLVLNSIFDPLLLSACSFLLEDLLLFLTFESPLHEKEKQIKPYQSSDSGLQLHILDAFNNHVSKSNRLQTKPFSLFPKHAIFL